MNDTILLGLSKEKFRELVEDVLRLNRDETLLALSESPLAESSLVEGALLSDEGLSQRGRALVMRGVLRWGIDQLRPLGEHSWLAERWRLYNVLFYPYIERMTFAQVAEKMGLAENTLLKRGRWRDKAITKLAQCLRRELKKQDHAAERKAYAIAIRYRQLLDDERQLLQSALVFRNGEPLPLKLLYDLGPDLQISNVSAAIQSLINANFLKSVAQGATLIVHPEMRTDLLTYLSLAERQRCHHATAEHYQRQHNYLEAAYHFRRMDNQQGYKLAACTLLEHQQAIINQQQLKEMGEFLPQFRRHELPDRLWCKLKILAGDVALATKKVERAIEEYGQALGAEELKTKALAYYKRAEVYRRRDLNQALAHYAYAVKLLEESNSHLPLLTEIYIDRAWIFIQERQDLTQAERNLQRAQEIIGNDRTLEAKLHNAWAGLYARQEEPQQVIAHRLQAWMAAEETQNLDLRMKISKNLGFDYAELLQDYQQALEYLKHSRKLALELANKQLEAVSLKDIGACYFWLGQYSQAIEYYQQAHTILVEAGNLSWQAALCLDLTEAYAEANELEQAKRYFDKGVAIAKKLGHTVILEKFIELARIYSGLPPIDADLNERQLKALEYVKKHGQITRQEYMELNSIGSATASRHLTDMRKKGFLVQKGKGRGTYYRQP